MAGIDIQFCVHEHQIDRLVEPLNRADEAFARMLNEFSFHGYVEQIENFYFLLFDI